MARVHRGSMAIKGRHLANRLHSYLLDNMTSPLDGWMGIEVYSDIYLLTEDGNIYQITRGGGMGGLGNKLIIKNYQADETTAMDMSIFSKRVQVGRSFTYTGTHWGQDVSGETPIVKEIIGVDEYHCPREELDGLEDSDISDRANALFLRSRSQKTSDKERSNTNNEV